MVSTPKVTLYIISFTAKFYYIYGWSYWPYSLHNRLFFYQLILPCQKGPIDLELGMMIPVILITLYLDIYSKDKPYKNNIAIFLCCNYELFCINNKHNVYFRRSEEQKGLIVAIFLGRVITGQRGTILSLQSILSIKS